MAKAILIGMVSLALAATGLPQESLADTGPKSDVWSILKSQGFTQQIGKGTSIRFFGKIFVGKRRFDIYYYTQEDINPIGASVHGSQDVIILQDGHIYIGRYLINSPPIGIHGRCLLFDGADTSSSCLRIGRDGPPSSLVIDGDILELRK
jgi:hypothetical protein